jgi:hypothetical protein
MKTLVILALLFVSVGAQGQRATPRKATLAGCRVPHISRPFLLRASGLLQP